MYKRQAQYRSSWDVLHPGRLFTKKLADGVVTPESVLDKLERYFAGLSVELIRETDEADGASQ